MVLDIDRIELKIRKSKEFFKIHPDATHWTLPIQGDKNLYDKAVEYAYNTTIESLDKKNLRKHIVKIRKNLCHKSEKQLLLLFKMAGKDSKEVKDRIHLNRWWIPVLFAEDIRRHLPGPK